MAHPPRSNPPLRSSSDPPSPCITPSTETFVLVVSFMVPFLSLGVLSSDPDGRTDLIGRGTVRATEPCPLTASFNGVALDDNARPGGNNHRNVDRGWSSAGSVRHVLRELRWAPPGQTSENPSYRTLVNSVVYIPRRSSSNSS